MVFEFVSGADLRCVLHHFPSLTCLNGSWGHVWPENGPKPKHEFRFEFPNISPSHFRPRLPSFCRHFRTGAGPRRDGLRARGRHAGELGEARGLASRGSQRGRCFRFSGLFPGPLGGRGRVLPLSSPRGLPGRREPGRTSRNLPVEVEEASRALQRQCSQNGF